MPWIDLCMMCPSGGCSNRKEIEWRHENCGEKLQINELAEVRCSYHRIPIKIFSHKFSCGLHPEHAPDRVKLISLMSHTLVSVVGVDDDWIITLITNLRRG